MEDHVRRHGPSDRRRGGPDDRMRGRRRTRDRSRRHRDDRCETDYRGDSNEIHSAYLSVAVAAGSYANSPLFRTHVNTGYGLRATGAWVGALSEAALAPVEW